MTLRPYKILVDDDQFEIWSTSPKNAATRWMNENRPAANTVVSVRHSYNDTITISSFVAVPNYAAHFQSQTNTGADS